MNAEAPPPITVKELAPDDAARWDAFVEDCGEASFFHRAGWKEVVEKSFGHRTYYLYAERGGIIQGVLPLVHIRSRIFSNALISNAFSVYGGPAARDDKVRAALDAHACGLADQLDVDHLEYRSRTRTHPDWPCQDGLYAIFRKDIDADPDANLKAIPRKQRAMVRKGIKAGLVGEIDGDVERLHHAYAVSVRNLGTPVFAKAYFGNLKRVFGDACEVLTITHEGAPVASVMSFYFRDQVLPYYGGGTERARALAANDFMYWDLMRRAGEGGVRVFDFGRSKRGTGAFSFKKNWGFEAQSLYYEFKLRRGGDIPDINPLNPKYRLFIALWKRLPLGVANLVGPRIVRNLG